MLRPGRGADTAAEHITVPDAALAQIPDTHRHGTDILIRADGAGGAKGFLALRKRGIHTFFSVGYGVTEPVRRAIRAHAQVAELTGTVNLADHPDGTRIIVRREHPRPCSI